MLSDAPEGGVRHVLVHEAAADVVLAWRAGARRRSAENLRFLLVPFGRVGEEVAGELGGHQAGAGQGQGDAAGVEGDPAPPPLLGHIGGRAAASGGIENEIAGVGSH